MIISLYEAGLMYTREDIERMSYTFLDNVWEPVLQRTVIRQLHERQQQTVPVYMDPGLNGPIYHGWSLVGSYSPEAQDVLFATLKAIIRGKSNPSLVRNTTSYGGMLGLTGHMLRNYRVLKHAAVPGTVGESRLQPAGAPPAANPPTAPAIPAH